MYEVDQVTRVTANTRGNKNHHMNYNLKIVGCLSRKGYS